MTANEAAEVFTWISSCVFVKKTGKKARGTLRVSERTVGLYLREGKVPPAVLVCARYTN